MSASLNSLTARVLIGSAIPLVMFGVVGLVAAAAISRLLNALALEKRSHEVVILAFHQQRQVERLAGAAPREAVPPRAYREAREQFHRLLGQLEDRVARADGTGAQAERLRELRELEADWHRLVSTRPPPADLPARAVPVRRRLESALGDFIAAEEAALEQQRAATEREASQGVTLLTASTALTLVLTVLLSLSVARSVTRPMNRLREAAGLLLAGRFRTLPPAGPAEVAELTVHFNHMALTLSERTSLLEQQRERYRGYIGAVAHILWTTDPSGRVVSDLPSWRGFTGQSEEAVRGWGWLDAIHPEERPAAEQAWRQAVEAKRPYDGEFRLRSAGGEYRHFACRGVPILNGNNSVREWVGTCTDITERKAREAAESASRAKSEFLARMSHELRTPLNAVIGMSRMLATQRFGPLTAKQADYLADITRAGEHLLALVNDILDLTRVEVGRLGVHADAFPVAQTVTNLTSTLRPLAESRGVSLRWEAGAEDGRLHTDPARFRQILYNLLSNAVKFTPSGGDVEVCWEWVDRPEREARVVGEASAGALRVSVRDTGIGIAPADQEAIWDEFRQLQPAGEGTGLGLALTRRLVGLLGGRVWLESEPGRGSTFTFVLPRQLPERSAAPEPLPAVTPGRRLALVIEDHPPTNKLLCDWLRDAGLRAESALDGVTGVAEARRLLPQLIVLDIHLPGLDGWQVLEELKADPTTAAIPVVIVSISDPELPARGLPVQAIFVKPIDRDEFLRRLGQHLPVARPDQANP